MASYEATEGKRVLLWIIEQRGRTLWTREGKAGGQGRISLTEHASEDEATRVMREKIAERSARGYVLTGADVGVSAPLRSRAQLERAARSSAKNALGFDVRELQNMLASALTAKSAGGPLTVGEVVDLFVRKVVEPCTWRLSALELSCRGDGASVILGARFTKGTGHNPDDDDDDGFRVQIDLPSLPRDDLAEAFVLDRFAEERRQLTAKSMGDRFRRALDDLEPWTVLAGSKALEVRVVG